MISSAWPRECVGWKLNMLTGSFGFRYGASQQKPLPRLRNANAFRHATERMSDKLKKFEPFNATLRTRREHADRLKRERQDFFDKFSPEARAVLNDLLDKYTEHGATQFQFPDALKIPPVSERGSVMEIAGYFGGPGRL